MAKRTTTTDAIRNELRRFISPGLDNLAYETRGGNNLPLDKQLPIIELIVIDCYFPGKMMLRGRLRDSVTMGVDTEEVYAHILVKEYHQVLNKSWLPSGEDKVDGKTGWNSRIPDETLIGVVEAIKGNPLNGHVFLGYVHMTDDGDLEVAPDPCLTEGEVDGRIDSLTPGIADSRAVIKINELVPGMTMDQNEVDTRINALTPSIADSRANGRIDAVVPGLITSAIAGKISIDEFVVGGHSGRITLSNGFYVEWGTAIFTNPTTGNNTVQVTFTHTFAYYPNVQLTNSNLVSGWMIFTAGSTSTSGFTAYLSVQTGATTTVAIRWLAIGKRAGY